MPVLIILIVVWLVTWLQRVIYRKLWGNHLDAHVSFGDKNMTAGQETELIETMGNAKWLPLPWVQLKFEIFRNGKSDNLFRADLFNILFHQQIVRKSKPGDVIAIPVETKKFGRIAAQAAKQVIIQGIREAERGIIYEEFTSKEHEILTGVVSHIEPRNGSVSIRISSNSEYTEAMLAPNERIKTEVLREGDRIKVYVVEVRNSTRGPQVLISRTHPGLVKRLFELEVPEIYDGTVEIKSIAREAGSRTKMAVWSADPDVDPIGSCVGPKGGRVASIVSELGGEKIDILPCDRARFPALPGYRQGGPERPAGGQAHRL